MLCCFHMEPGTHLCPRTYHCAQDDDDDDDDASIPVLSSLEEFCLGQT